MEMADAILIDHGRIPKVHMHEVPDFIIEAFDRVLLFAKSLVAVLCPAPMQHQASSEDVTFV